MTRDVRVQMNFVLRVAGDGSGLPRCHDALSGIPSELHELLAEVGRLVVPDASELLPGGKISVSLTRASALASRRAARAQARSGSAPARRTPAALLAERGLANTRQNRRRVAVLGVLDDAALGSQDEHEELAWRLVEVLARTREGSARRPGAVDAVLRQLVLGDGDPARRLRGRLAAQVEQAYRETP